MPNASSFGPMLRYSSGRDAHIHNRVLRFSPKLSLALNENTRIFGVQIAF
jgi:hypothetical protein